MGFMFVFVTVVLKGSLCSMHCSSQRGDESIVGVHKSVSGVVQVCPGGDLVAARAECTNSNHSGVWVQRERIILQVHFVSSGCVCVAVFIVKLIGV